MSHFYETEPVGGVVQKKFYNAAARLVTTLPPLALLDELKRIEVQVFHRIDSGRWGPRSMDLDILLYGDLVLSGEQLTIPHPHLAERRFALQPLADIDPALVHPSLGSSIVELLAALTTTETVARI